MSDHAYPAIDTAEQRLKLWKEIEKAGGIERYIKQTLQGYGFSLRKIDASTLSAKKKSAYKKEKKAEAEARRQLRHRTWKAYQETHIVHLGDGIFYNDLVDADKFDVEKREKRLSENQLPAINNVNELADFFGISIAELRWLTYNRQAEKESHYARFTIPKSNGKVRIISAPKPKLKAAQHKILYEILDGLSIHGKAHGFVPGRSIASHAQNHAGAKVLVKMDVKDFFPSITFPRVKGLFRKLGYQEQVAVILALLCTESPRLPASLAGEEYQVALGPRSLPQGAPTSPTITNLICRRLDRRMSGLAQKMGFVYSRYADDLAFSWHKEDKPKVGVLLKQGRKIIQQEGFQPHPDKTRILRHHQRQKLTGLIINPLEPEAQEAPKARVPRKTIRQLKAAIYNRQQGKPVPEDETLDQLQGMAAFIYQTNPEKGALFLEQINALKQKESS